MRAHERQRTRGRIETEARVRRARLGLARLAVGPDEEKLLRSDRRASGELPLQQAGVIIGEVEVREVNRRVAGVVKLYPRIAVAAIVGEAGDVVRQHLVEPHQRERR